MKKKIISIILFLFVISMMTSCSHGVYGGLYTGIKTPGQITDHKEGVSKVGISSAMSVLGLFAVGDASIQTAMENGGITKVHHVDYKTRSVLFLIYNSTTTIVYGE